MTEIKGSAGSSGGSVRFAGVKRHWLAMAVAASLIAGGLSWSSIAQACMVTTTIARPTGLRATVNPPGEMYKGILLKWDAAAAADKVFEHKLFRGKDGGALIHIGTTTNVGVYHPSTDTTVYLTNAPEWEWDFAFDGLEDGATYTYRILAVRRDNCGGRQESAMSDPATATYRNP